MKTSLLENLSKKFFTEADKDGQVPFELPIAIAKNAAKMLGTVAKQVGVLNPSSGFSSGFTTSVGESSAGDTDHSFVVDSLLNRFEKLSNPKRKLSAELNLHLRRTIYWAAKDGALAVKRGVDVVGAAAGVVVLSPVFLSVIAAIKLEDGGSIVYTSKRVGRHGKEFDFYKFRSMVENAEQVKDTLLEKNESEAGVIFKMKDDPRITRVGKFIRKTSIDELPQLFNVLKGDMSLVGPRPPLPREVEQYRVGDRYRLEVIPGLTCLWQVKGRSDLDFHQQVELDRTYIHDQTLWNDILLILQTVPAVLSGQGSY